MTYRYNPRQQFGSPSSPTPPVTQTDKQQQISLADIVLFALLIICVVSAFKLIASTPPAEVWQNMVDSSRAASNFAQENVIISVTDGPPPVIHNLVPTSPATSAPTALPAQPQVIVVTATYTPTPIPTATATPTARPTTDAQRSRCSEFPGACSQQSGDQRSNGN